MVEKKDSEKAPEIAAEELEGLSTLEQANKITRRFVWWSAGGGLLPIPLVDLTAIYAAQVTMITQMSKVYGITFSEHKFKNVLLPLFGSIGIMPVATGLLSSVVKIIPGVGHIVSGLSLPAMAGAITYATGKIFTAHFEAGGTLLDFNPDGMKEHYKKLFEEGKAEVKPKVAA
jgi:uncharacterized protein (DUF697 family)